MASTLDAIRLTAELERMIIDPVYEGKSMAGLIDLARDGEIAPTSTVLYATSAGSPPSTPTPARLLTAPTHDRAIPAPATPTRLAGGAEMCGPGTADQGAEMADTETKLGGACGVVAAVAMIPAYVVGTPDEPRTPEEAIGYYESAAWFVTANGALPLLHVLLGLVFLGVLVRVLRQTAGPSGAVYVALAGGVLFFALTSVGFAAEIAYPAAVVRFGDVLLPALAQPLLVVAVWSYHYAQIGAALLIFATSFVAWRTRALPSWVAGAGVLGVLPLLHLWLPLLGALSSLIWFAVLGVALLAAPPVPATARDAVAT